jgi:hypothetical protein
MPLNFTFNGDGRARMGSVVSVDWDYVTDKPGLVLYDEQTLTSAQKEQARDNIGAARNDIFNVKDYGALGDGSTDDAVAVQTAVTAVLASSTGGVLYFPSGTYIIGTQITIPNTAAKFLVMRGDGASSTITNAAGLAGTAIFYVGGASASTGYFRFENFRVKGAATATARAFHLENANVAVFSGVSFWTLNVAVELESSYSVSFIDKTFWRDINTYAVYSSTHAHHLVMDDVVGITTGISSGAFLKIGVASDNVSVTNSDFEEGYVGVDLAGGTAFTFRDNYVEYFDSDPIKSSATLHGPDVSNNWISLGAAWEIGNFTRGQFVRNSIFDQTITFSATTFTEMFVAQNRTSGTGSLPAAAIQRWVGAGTETTKFLNARTIGVQNITAGASIVANQQVGALGFYNLANVATAGISAHYTNNADGATSYMSFRTAAVDDQATLDSLGNYSGKGSATFLNATAIPAGGTAGAGVKLSSTSNFGVFFGSGAPTLSAAKGSLYLRSDGSTTNDRAYINTDGGTTWTALTTAA